MSTESELLSSEEIVQIAQNDDFHIAPLRENGITYGTPTWIWSVMVDNMLFVRAYNGTRSGWYKAAIKQKAGKIEAAGIVKKVRFEPVSGDINDRIDEAYRKKYSDSPYLASMIRERARASTVRVF
jgi:hypothetical protein